MVPTFDQTLWLVRVRFTGLTLNLDQYEPQFGGHIERLIGTFMKEVHGINGTTFSNIKEKDNYDSEKKRHLP